MLDHSGSLDGENTQRAAYKLRLAVVQATGDEGRIATAFKSLNELDASVDDDETRHRGQDSKVNLTVEQSEILSRLRSHFEPIRRTQMGFEINGRYLCDGRAMGELVRLKQVTMAYVDGPSGGRYCVYSANVQSPIVGAAQSAQQAVNSDLSDNFDQLVENEEAGRYEIQRA